MLSAPTLLGLPILDLANHSFVCEEVGGYRLGVYTPRATDSGFGHALTRDLHSEGLHFGDPESWATDSGPGEPNTCAYEGLELQHNTLAG